MTKRRLKKDKRWAFIKFCFFAYLFIGVFALIWLGTEVVSLEYELGQLESKKIELLRDTQKSTAERASIYSVEKVERIATKKLGMSLPERERVFFVRRTAGAAPHKVSVKSAANNDSSNRTLLKKIRRVLEENVQY